MQSLWEQTVEISERNSLTGEFHVENVVIGAGMAGILTAYFLQKQGREVVVLEAAKVGSGQTQNTTAKITSQHGLIYQEIWKKVGKERAHGYAQANEAAIKAYQDIVEAEVIQCHFERVPSYLYTTQKAKQEQLKKEAEVAKKLGIKACYMETCQIKELPFEIEGAVCFEEQAQFHPLEFIKALADKLSIYEHTKVLEVKGHKIVTDGGTIEAKHIIFATHYPFPVIPGYYFLRQHQERSYVLALEGKGVEDKLSGMYYSIDKGGISFRSAEGKILLGGGSHRTGKQSGFCYLREMARKYYPDATESAAWAAQDCMPHDKFPFIGKYAVTRPNWYVATGFQKWGMTSSMIAARIISDKICVKENPYEKVFSPQRLLFRAGIKNLCMDIGESIVGLTKGFLGKKERRCRHMGCGLVWNKEEQSWDCPCHGSRYDKNGELIDNPAQEKLLDGQKYENSNLR